MKRPHSGKDTLKDLSATRIVATALALSLHAAAALFFVGAHPGHPKPETAEVVTEIVFIASSSSPSLIAHPPPPPPPPPRDREGVISETPVEIAIAASEVQAQGVATVETMTLGSFRSPVADAEQDMPAPDVPASEILSYRTAFQPVYPPAARDAGEGGWVTLRVLVGPDGLPERLELISSTATGRLVQAAIEAVKQWRFNPALKDGQPVPSWVEVPIGFWSSPRTAAH